jgi:TatD DNase family protein
VGPDPEVTRVSPGHGRRAAPPAPEPLPAPTVDTHTHLDACGGTTAADVAAAMDRAAAVGVTRAVTVADDLASARWVVQAAHWDDRVVAAVALHPTRTASASDADHAEIEQLARDPRVVAVGETGLDYYWDYAPPHAQQESFRRHIDLAKRLGKPLMIHDRDAHADVLRILREEAAPETVIFHCFSGDAAMARECVDAGYVLSFAGPVTFRNARELQEAAVVVPEDRLLVETDAPFLTPHPHRGRANEPYCLPWTVRGLAALRSVPADRLAAATCRNAERVFRLAELPLVPSSVTSGGDTERSA